MRGIEIAKAGDDPRAVGRPLMSDHNLSARVWASAALLAVLLDPSDRLGWWLPLHLALLGTASQAIAGGQLMFSATLGLARGPSRTTTVAQLGLLNIGAMLVIGGRLWGSTGVLAAGATIFAVAIAWVVWLVHRLWRRSVNRRFEITGTFYRLAGISILVGATIGGALGIGAFDDATSYLAHRSVHMTVNVLGWAGLTTVGTAITLLPTILHVRAPGVERLRPAPWLMFGGLMLMATGATFDTPLIAVAAMALYASGLALFATYVAEVFTVPRRRKVPTGALHLAAALGWLGITTVGLIVSAAAEDPAALRDLVVVGGGAGFVFQAILGAWSFLLPSTRPPIPERRRSELVAMEIGGRTQVVAYNLGLVFVLLGLRFGFESALGGIVLAWTAAIWALIKTWTFPLLARVPAVKRWGERWWAPPDA